MGAFEVARSGEIGVAIGTEQQANEGVSLEAQEAKIQAWCTANGYELVQVYVDAGISGKTTQNRPELAKTRKAIKKGMALVTYSLSRLARSTKDLLEISEEVSKKKADLVSGTEKIDTTTPMGEMMFTLMTGMAQLERRMIAERTATALLHGSTILITKWEIVDK